jgi:hypothetical protein
LPHFIDLPFFLDFFLQPRIGFLQFLDGFFQVGGKEVDVFSLFSDLIGGFPLEFSREIEVGHVFGDIVDFHDRFDPMAGNKVSHQ